MRPVLAGVVTALVGFGGAFPVVLAGLRAVGAERGRQARLLRTHLTACEDGRAWRLR